MAKIFVTRRIPEPGLKLLAASHQVELAPQDAPIGRQALLAGVREADGLLCMLTDAIDQELLQAAPRLKAVANYAVGTNNIDVKACKERGVLATNTPDVLTQATAELAFGLILDVARGMTSGDKALRQGGFKGWGPLYRLGREVSGKTLGIIGFGRIGQALAAMAKGFNMKVLYHQRTRLPRAEALYLGLDELLSQSDFVSLHCPLSPETKHLMGAPQFELMPSTAYLINTARGPVVDEKALVQALRKGKIAGAGLDVYEQEPLVEPGLLDLDNVVLLPHLGSSTLETREAMALRAGKNLLQALAGERPQDLIS